MCVCSRNHCAGGVLVIMLELLVHALAFTNIIIIYRKRVVVVVVVGVIVTVQCTMLEIWET